MYTENEKGKSFDRPKHVVPDWLDVRAGEQFAFTLNPLIAVAPLVANVCQSGPSSGFADIYNGIIALLNCCRNMDFLVVPEVSKHGRIHVHGFCRFVDVARAYVYDIPLLESKATVCIKLIDDWLEWHEYVYKSHNLAVELCDDARLPYVFDSYKLAWEALQRSREDCEAVACMRKEPRHKKALKRSLLL